MQRLPAFVVIVLFFIAGCKNNSSSNSTESTEINTSGVPLINYSIVSYFPHDTTLFIEGFVYHDGKLFESAGADSTTPPYTNSVIGIDDLHTGKSDRKIFLDKKIYFGEGIVFLYGKLYQLTWKNHIGFIYDAKTFRQAGTFNYPTQGWALTTDGKNIIMDDGSDTIFYLDPVKLNPVKSLIVTEDGMQRDNLNELEFIKGYIYANIWQTNEIVKIDTGNGKVIGKLNLQSIVEEAQMKHPEPGDNVLNGIAYDSAQDKIYVTGKLWQNIYQINFRR